MTQVTPRTPEGTRVRVRGVYYGPVEGTGTIVRVSGVSHATMNGGGYDVRVRMDEPLPPEQAARARAAQRHLGGRGQENGSPLRIVTVRSTCLEVIA